MTADPREKGLGRFDRQRLRLGHLQRDPRGGQTHPLVVCGKHAVVADAFEAARQHVRKRSLTGVLPSSREGRDNRP